ncbi:MAG: POTRA domain-containing protein [Thermoanaerobaculia bacterium]
MAGTRARTLCALLVAAFAATSVAAQEPEAAIAPELYGRTVESVAYTADGEVDRKEVTNLIVIEAGRPLTEAGAGATIRNLFKTLRYANVVISGEPAPGGGVAVTVHLWKAYRVSKVAFEGKSSLSREELRRAAGISEGDPFHASALEAGEAALERRLSTEGYLNPDVEPEATFEPRTFSVEIVYRIAAGQRARVAEPFFDGGTKPFAEAVLVKKGKVRIGRLYSEAKARASADRMRRFLLEEGYFRANAELIAAEPTEDGRLRPVYRVSAGPRYELQVSGIKEKAARKEILGLLQDQSFDDGLLELWVSDRKDQLQRAGHYRAKVSASVAENGDPIVIKMAVEPGPKYAVASIAIRGNASVPEKTLRELMVTRKKGLPVVGKGRLSDRDLEEDVRAILGYYQTQGWIDAKVEKPVVRDGAKPGLLEVELAIVEGPRAYVEERTVQGAAHLTPADVDRIVSVRVGAPFNPSAVRQDVAALTDYYWNNGWRDATVQDRYTLSEDRAKVAITYRVEEGMRSFFGKTILRGNAITDPDRIFRQVAWKEGEPYSEEKIADTQQNLARTGVFRTIEVRPEPADPQNQSRTVDVTVTEARRLSLLYGFGYQNAAAATENRNDAFGVVGATYRNLFGLMQSASVEAQYAPLSKRGHLFLNFLEPYLFGTTVPLNIVGFVSREPIQDINIDRLGGYLESVRFFRRYLRVGLRFEYQRSGPTNPEDLSTIELEKFPKSDQPINQSAIGPSFLWDRRDDILDPHRGYYASLAGKYAFPFLSADARYGKVSGQFAWFRSVFGGVFGASVRAGMIYPYDLAAQVPVPIPERFYAGGSTTARGFDTDLAGIPRVTVDYNTQARLHQGSGSGTCAAAFPDLAIWDCNEGPRIIGGNGFMAWSFEYRRPIFGNLGVSLFYDLAQVWTNAGDINFRIEGETGLRQSIGAGLHYMTPIGPLRLEYGTPVDARTIPFEVTSTVQADGSPCDPSPCVLKRGLTTKEKGRILLSIGYPF